MLVSIVTLNYKKPELTINCVFSLWKQFKKEFENNDLELIIIDNASGDNSKELIEKEIKEKKYKNIKFIESGVNGGFGKGCNLGAEKSKGDYILFLNNDTQIKDNGILSMARYMKVHPEIAILGGQLRNMDGSLQSSAGKFYNLFNAILLLFGFQKYGLLDNIPLKIEKVDWVKGGLLMIERKAFLKLGGFDEKIFMYTEDMELCYRAKKMNYLTYFYPNVNILHMEHGSSSRTFAIINIYKNLLYFYKKHKSIFEYQILKIFMSAKAILLIIVGSLSGNSYIKQTYAEALKAIS